MYVRCRPRRSEGMSGLGLSLKPPKWLRNLVRGVQSQQITVPGAGTFTGSGVVPTTPDAPAPAPQLAGALPLAIGAGLLLLLMGRRRG